MKLTSNMLAVVTGGASGMGQATARAIAAQGCKVIVLDRNIKAAEQVAAGINGMAIECDVADSKQLEQVFSTIQELEGQLRVVVNCAGIAPAKRAVGRDGPMPLSDFDKVIQINLVGTFNVIRLAAEQMFNSDMVVEERGVILNTASIAAYEGQIGQVAYSASKGGIVSMTLPLAREFASQGIRVNTIAPGLIATPLLLNMPQEVQDSLAATIPFPKRFGRVEEYASLVCHLIENSMINGEVIRLDGALRMQER